MRKTQAKGRKTAERETAASVCGTQPLLPPQRAQGEQHETVGGLWVLGGGG